MIKQYNIKNLVGAIPIPLETMQESALKNDNKVIGPAQPPKTVNALFAALAYIANIFSKLGMPKNVLVYALAQTYLESSGFSSNVSQKDNNFSGIKYLANSSVQKNASKGLKAPEGGNYAHFDTFEDWVRDYIRILSLKGSKGRPIDATSAAQFGDALRANKYFTDPNYSVKFNADLKKVNDALTWGQQQDKNFLQQYNNGQTNFTYDATKGLTDNTPFDLDRKMKQLEQFAKDHPIITIGGGLATLFLIKKVFE